MIITPKSTARFGIIYKATNLINGKVYVGKTVKTLARRRTEHVSHNTQTDTVFRQAIRKYGKQNFEWVVIERCPIELLSEREMYYIKQLGSLVTQHGYNLTEGGDGAAYGDLNVSNRPEVREKLSRASTGFKHAPETLRIMSEKSKAYYINGMPDEQRKSISNSLKGHPGHQKMKQSYRFLSPDGQIFDVLGVREFAREHGLDHSSLVKVSKGKLKSHKGWCLYVKDSGN